MGKFRNYSFEKCFSKEDLPLAFHLDIMKEPYQLHTLHVKPGSLKFEYYNKYGCGLWLPTSIGEFSIISKNALLFPSFQYFPGSNKYFLFLQKWNAQNFVLFTTLHCHYWRWKNMHSSVLFSFPNSGGWAPGEAPQLEGHSLLLPTAIRGTLSQATPSTTTRFIGWI